VNILDTYCQSMIDTVHIFKENVAFPQLNWKRTIDDEFGTHHKSHISNMIISWSNGKLRIVGSLPKLINDNNFYNLTNEGIGRAIKLLEEELQTDLQEAEVRRIDLAANLNLKYNIEQYYACLGEYKKFHRNNIDRSTLYYSKKKKAHMCFYDKCKLMREEGYSNEVLDKISGNHMRYESRNWLPEIRVRFKEGLTVSDLSKIDVNHKLIDLWYQNYLDIKKESPSEFGFEAAFSMKELDKLLFKLGIDKLGGVASAFEYLKRTPVFMNSRPEYKSRARKKIRMLGYGEDALREGLLLSELNESFNKVYSNFMNHKSLVDY